MALPQKPASVGDKAREIYNATQFLAAMPTSYQDRQRAPGTADDVWGANYVYWVTYPEAPAKIAKSDEAGAEAWKRIREVLNNLILAKAKTSPGWDPSKPTWPLPTTPKKWSGGSAYKARRPWKADQPQTRYHCGTDLKAAAGLVVFATEAGVVIAPESGWEMKKVAGVWKGVKSLIMQTDSGLTILYGGIRPGSARVTAGTRVAAGDVLAEIGNYPGGDSMLHFQLYTGHLSEAQVNARKSWSVNTAPPPGLLDPAEYLTACMTNPKLASTQQVALYMSPAAADDGALVVNDVEGGEENEGTPQGAGTPAGGSKAGAGIMAGIVAAVLLVVAGGRLR